MGLPTSTQSIWVKYLKYIIKEQGKGEARCQSACLKTTIYCTTFFAASVCSKWKLHPPNV